jgi:hypothetical protein
MAVHCGHMPADVLRAFRRFGLDLPGDRADGPESEFHPGDVYGVYEGAGS